jgi:hypothetical protein
MNFEPLNYYSAKRIREDKAFTIELPVTPQSAPDGKREKDACESLVARGFLVEVNRNIFVKNYRAPK